MWSACRQRSRLSSLPLTRRLSFPRSSSSPRTRSGPTAAAAGSGNTRHFLFMGAFVATSFVTCSAWAIERSKSEQANARSASSIWRSFTPGNNERRAPLDLSQIESRTLLERIRSRLLNSPDATKTLLVLSALNLSVFLAWKTPFRPVQSLLQRLFLSQPYSHRVLPHLLSSFSHFSGTHLALNMVGLWSFGRFVHEEYGREQFVFLYSSSAVVSSVLSHWYAGALGRMVPALGASGAVLAVLAAFTYHNPDHRLMLVFLPFVSFPAWTALAALTAFDGFGTLLGWQVFDHAAHLGGIMFGYAYAAKLREWTWQHKESVVASVERLWPKPPKA